MENVEMKTTAPRRGLGLLHKANLMAVIATILAIVSGITAVMTAGMGLGMAMENGTVSGGMLTVGVISALVTVGSFIFLFVAGVMEIVALFKLSPIHAGYKSALIWVLVSLVASLIVSLPTLPGAGDTSPLYQTFSKLWDIAPPIFGLLKVYFIIGATVAILTAKGDMPVSAKGAAVRRIYIICTAVIVIAELVALVPALVGFASFVTVVTSTVQLVALLKYIGFLGGAVKALEA